MKIYTKGGDSGTTSLFGGKRVGKDDVRVEAYGGVDELNGLLGVIISETTNPNRIKKLARIQEELMVLGSDLSSPLDVSIKIPRVTKVFTARLEKEIDAWEKTLPQVKNFILPGGSLMSAKLHLARSTARRCERSIAKLAREEHVNKNIPAYINRLSDWLFVLARHVNQKDKFKEIIWKGRKK